MKFGDKLIQLRKKNGLSQEELAEKLNVSRQSVSKWESNNTYPETDKIIQICNIFDCSMDDLINDKVVDIEQTMRKNKNNLNEALDSLLDFITKTVNMFSKMTFKSGIKCVFEMIVLVFILYIGGSIVSNIIGLIISKIFNFLDYGIIRVIEDIVIGILYILWFIISVIVLVHTFKIRYLNDYVEVNKQVEKNNNKEVINKEEKTDAQNIIIKDESSKPFEFLKLLSKIFIIGFKILVLWILLIMSFFIIGLIVIDIISIALIPTNSLFIGVFISLLSITVIGVLLFTLGTSFVFNKKIPGKVSVIIIVASLLVCGVGTGITALSIKNLKIIDTTSDIYKYEEKVLETTYEDTMAIKMNDNYVDYIYKIDNSMNENDIVLKANIDTRFHTLTKPNYNRVEDEIKIYYLQEEFNNDYKELFDFIKSDLKKNQIHTFYDYEEAPTLFIIANENTINKLLDNFKKLYLVEEIRNEDSITVRVKDYKVYFPYGVRGTYSAIEDKVYLNDEEDYSCVRSITETEYGDKIIYSCKWNDDEEE